MPRQAQHFRNSGEPVAPSAEQTIRFRLNLSGQQILDCIPNQLIK